jgi:hypothetical protein
MGARMALVRGTKHKHMKRIVLTYGIIGGIIVSAMMWFTLGDGNHDWENGEMIGYTTMVIALSTNFFGVKSYRDKHLSGSITFGKAFLVGLYITLIASTMYVASWLVISANTEQDFMESYITHTEAKMKASGTPEAEIAAEVQEMRAMGELYKNPVVKVGFTYMEILPVGLLISLVCAALLKRREAPTGA